MINDKCLWFIAKGRKIPVVMDWIKSVDFVDKLIISNHMHHRAYEIALDFFNKHKEYDYFITSSDDTFATPCHIKRLLKDEEEHGFPIIGGWNNRRLDDGFAALTLKPVKTKEIKSLKAKAYQFLSIRNVFLGSYGYPFIKVWFSGLPLTLITRETLQKVPFRPFMRQKDRLCITPETKKNGRGVMFDLQFALDCSQAKIPIRVDTRVFLLHCKRTKRMVRVGVDPPKVELIRRKK